MLVVSKRIMNSVRFTTMPTITYIVHSKKGEVCGIRYFDIRNIVYLWLFLLVFWRICDNF